MHPRPGPAYDHPMRIRKLRPIVDRWKMQDARRAAGESRTTAAAKLDVSPSAINSYEQGRSDPSARVLIQMAWLYGVPAETMCRTRQQVADELDEQEDTALAARTAP